MAMNPKSLPPKVPKGAAAKLGAKKTTARKMPGAVVGPGGARGVSGPFPTGKAPRKGK